MNELNIKYQKVSEWHQLGKPCSTLQQRRVQWAQYQQDLQNIITPPQCKQEGGVVVVAGKLSAYQLIWQTIGSERVMSSKSEATGS